MDTDLARLTARFAELGAQDPEGWARSELEEDIPQQARFIILWMMWRYVIDPLPAEASEIPAARRLLDAGAVPADVAQLISSTAARAVYRALVQLEQGYDAGAPDDAPGWVLFENRPSSDPNEEPELTGRIVDALSESFLNVPGEDHAEAAYER